ncbi:MAG: anaerobic ribonucleoside-triphosphate reductase activating protein [Lachnospiraceae bacterium]|nr:anaerobic ribonucleoside-triphosphate reductase activating protein [Lachnospiraceae bacterium]
MRICGLNKTTLLDYPGHVAATVFLGGCNFRCPFCQNGDLVLKPEGQPAIEKEAVMAFLRKRKGVLTGVCITGGEPTIERGLEELIEEIKDIGYLLKLDTNGYCPEVIRKLTEKGLVDYIAMDIKNDLKKYGETVGIQGIDAGRIMDSIRWIINGKTDYEFRTTVVKELHGREDMSAIGKAIKGAKAYFLQGYQESGGVIAPGFHAYGKEEMEELAEWVRPFVPNVQLRGVE